MSKTIQLTFSSTQSSLAFDWQIAKSNLALKWFEEMKLALTEKNIIREQKFFGFSSSNSEHVINKINHAIDIINKHFGSLYQIPIRASLNIHQADLNELHHHFEILMGQSWNRSHYLMGAPTEVHIAVRWLNDYVHELEYILGAKSEKKMNGGFQLQLVPQAQRELQIEDLELFSYKNEPGNLVTNYCQLGKTWSDVYLDDDQAIHPDNIAPLRYYSSGFICNFFECNEMDAKNFTKKIKAFIREKSGKFGVDIDPDDPKNALGYAVLAKPSKHSVLKIWGQNQLNDFFFTHDNITKISLADERGTYQKSFPIKDSYLGMPEGVQI